MLNLGFMLSIEVKHLFNMLRDTITNFLETDYLELEVWKSNTQLKAGAMAGVCTPAMEGRIQENPEFAG